MDSHGQWSEDLKNSEEMSPSHKETLTIVGKVKEVQGKPPPQYIKKKQMQEDVQQTRKEVDNKDLDPRLMVKNDALKQGDQTLYKMTDALDNEELQVVIQRQI